MRRSPFEELAGVRGIVSGYTAGDVADPTCEQVEAFVAGLEASDAYDDPIVTEIEPHGTFREAGECQNPV